MKLLYLTAIKYPSTTATAHQIKSMSRVFKEALGDNFLLIVYRARKQNLRSLNFYEMNCPFSLIKLILSPSPSKIIPKSALFFKTSLLSLTRFSFSVQFKERYGSV